MVTETWREQVKFWGVVELTGHVRTAGLIEEVEMFGVRLGRCNVPKEDGSFFSYLFAASAIYRITPTTEEVARMIAAHATDADPLQPWQLPGPRLAARSSDEADDGEGTR